MKEKIIKLLKLSTSSNDNEALNAIRIANSLLKKEDMHWDEFFSKSPSLSNTKEREYIKKINTLEKKLENFLYKTMSLSNEKEREYVKRINRLKNELDECYRNSAIRKSVEEKKKRINPHIEFGPHRIPKDVKEKIEICLEAYPDHSFLSSIYDFFNREGYLTPKQLDALDMIYKYL